MFEQLIIVMGHDRSGKSTVSEYLGSRIPLEVVELGDCVRAEQSADGTLSTDTSAAFLELQERRGEDVVVAWAARSGSSTLVVTGVRDRLSYQALARASAATLTIGVSAPPSVRHRRRRDLDTSMSLNGLAHRDQLHATWGLTELLSSADVTIRNAGTLADLHRITDGVVARVKEMLSNVNHP